MIEWNDLFYFSIISAALMLSVLGLWFNAILPGTDRWSRRFFLYYFIVFILCCLFAFTDMTLSLYTPPKAAVYFIMILECLFLSIPLPMLTVYLLHCCGENIRRSRLLHIALGLCAVYVILLLSDPFTDVFSYAAPDNQYYRGSLYPLLLVPLIAILLLNLAGVIHRRKQLSVRAFLSILIAILPMTAALAVQLFIDVFPLIDISYVLSALSMYSLILSDQIEQDLRYQREIARQQQEIAHQHSSVMVLQMRPHFIYNTLMTIYSLCNQDPQKARQVTMDFTNYLRKNFNAIASENPIPFSAELEHTRAYLAVEQAQFEDLLLVEFDTPFTSFRLPSLTLQPIAENAVKHGMNPYAGSLHVLIRTRHTDAGSVILVEDNDPGFALTEDSEPHTALTNIRQRLEMMCGGKLEITPRDGGGTTVTVTIPDRKAKG